MKLPLLLSQYLREHQQLRLPGLGSFYASPSAVSSGTDAAPPPVNIRFEPKPVKDPDDSLIDFIKQHTGKIKPLAVADLSSYIESGLQLLNIGKPFYIEGIGTIQKTREGKYDFAARELAATPLQESSNDRAEQTEKKKSIFDDVKYTPSANPWQKFVVAALILGGLAIVVLGGYYLYSENNGESRASENTAPLIDTTTTIQKDTLNVPQDTTRSLVTYAAASAPAGSYKFVLETTNNKKRAFRRYNQLKSYFLPIQMETSDSLAFKLYFLIPANASDTGRIRDSLSRYYVSKVRIEQ